MLVLFLLAYNYRKNIQMAMELVKHSKAPRKNILLLNNLLQILDGVGSLKSSPVGQSKQQISSLLDFNMYVYIKFCSPILFFIVHTKAYLAFFLVTG